MCIVYVCTDKFLTIGRQHDLNNPGKKYSRTVSGVVTLLFRDLDEALEMGMDWSLREGYVWAEDKVWTAGLHTTGIA